MSLDSDKHDTKRVSMVDEPFSVASDATLLDISRVLLQTLLINK